MIIHFRHYCAYDTINAHYASPELYYGYREILYNECIGGIFYEY